MRLKHAVENQSKPTKPMQTEFCGTDPTLDPRFGNASAISFSALLPTPRADPRALGVFENKPANAPWPGQPSRSIALRYNLINFLVSGLTFIVI